jgi:cholinesterase
MLMGTHGNFRGASSELEEATSRAFQDAYVAFASDPSGGLQSQSWEVYSKLGGTNVREFGAGVAAKDISVADTEALCNGAGLS